MPVKRRVSEQVEHADRDALQRLDRQPEREADRRLAGQVVDLVRPRLVDDLEHAPEVGQRHRHGLDATGDAQPVVVGERRRLGVARRPDDGVALV